MSLKFKTFIKKRKRDEDYKTRDKIVAAAVRNKNVEVDIFVEITK